MEDTKTEGLQDIKQCPKCAEDIKAAAVICKHCGYDFNERTIPKQQQPPVISQAVDVKSGVFGGLVKFFIGIPLAILGLIFLYFLLSTGARQLGDWLVLIIAIPFVYFFYKKYRSGQQKKQ